TLPVISTLTNRTVAEDSPLTVPFTVSDATTPATLLTVTGKSSNPSLVPANQIVFGGSGTNRTVTLTPATNQFGVSTITLTVTDTNFGMVSTNFLLTIAPVNDLPAISGLT